VPTTTPAFVEPHLLGQLRLPDGRVLSGMSFSQAAAVISQAAQVPRLILPDPALRTFERRAPGQRSFDPFASEVNDTAVDATQIVPPLRGTAIAGGNADAIGYPLAPPAVAPTTGAAAGGSATAALAGKFGDRVIVFAAGTGLEVFAGGSPKALLVCSAITQQPQAAGFVGDAMLVADGDHLMRINAAGEVVWDFSLRTLGDLEVAVLGASPTPPATGAETVVQAESDGAAERNRELVREQALAANGIPIIPGNPLLGQQVIGQQIVIVNGQAVQIGRMGAGGNQLVGSDVAAPTAETIVKVVAAGKRLVAATSDGRVLCINQANGHLLWQTRLDDHNVDQLLADDDFVAVRSGAAATFAGEQTTAHIVVFNADDGHAQFQRSFGADGGPPLNMALAPDGTLVWLLIDRIAGKNLFEPGQRLRFETFPWQGQSNARCFGSESGGAMEPDQLLIDGHRILTVADSGLALRAFSLDDGQPVALPNGATRINLANVPNRWDVHIRAGGDGVYYAWSVGNVQRFDFSPSAGGTQPSSWQWPLDPLARSAVEDVELTSRYAMIFYETGFHRNRPEARLRLCVDCMNPATAYIELQKRNILDESGIIDFRLVDGGFYYLSGTGRLHFFPGAARK
jgi:outer membrane protein assembly factor BamB